MIVALARDLLIALRRYIRTQQASCHIQRHEIIWQKQQT
jgi:hypothetical protein